MTPLSPIKRRVIANHYKVVLSVCFYPITKHLYADGSDLFKDDNFNHREQEVTEWFGDY